MSDSFQVDRYERAAGAPGETRLMRKIRCPQCAVVNLERFVTYPHCAGCGALLPQAEGSPEQLPRISRPIKPFLWAAAVGLAIVLLVSAAAMFDSSPPRGQYEVYGRAPRGMTIGKSITADLTLDDIDNVSARRDTVLHGVEVRVSDQFFHNVRFMGIDPKPDHIYNSGRGRYFYYGDFPLGGTVRLRLLPFRTGYANFDAQMYANNQVAGTFTAVVDVRK